MRKIHSFFKRAIYNIKKRSDSFDWGKWGNVAQVAMSIITFFGLIFTSITIFNQQQQFRIDKRPYLSVNIDKGYKGIIDDGKNYLFGGDIYYLNYGSYFADNIETKYLIADNVSNKNQDYKEYALKTEGAFSEIKIVPPKSNNGPISYYAGVSINAKYVCMGVLIKYKGFDRSKIYWFKLLRVFQIEKDKNGNPNFKKFGSDIISWDSNTGSSVSELEMPDWNKIAEFVSKNG